MIILYRYLSKLLDLLNLKKSFPKIRKKISYFSKKRKKNDDLICSIRLSISTYNTNLTIEKRLKG